MRKRADRSVHPPKPRRTTYDRSVDETARPILEVGAVLLSAAGAGWLARRLHVARRHRLPRGRVARLAVHARLRRRARPAHPVRRRRGRLPALRGRHRGRPRTAAARPGPAALGGAAPDVVTMAIASLAFLAAGLGPPPRPCSGCRSPSRRASSSSTSRAAGDGRRIRTPSASSSAGACSRTSPAWPSRSSAGGLGVGSAVRRVAGRARRVRRPRRRRGQAPAAGAPSAPPRARSVPARVGVDRAGGGRRRRGPGRDPDRPGGVHRRPGHQRQPRRRRGSPPASPVPRRVRGVLLRRHRDAHRSAGAGGRRCRGSCSRLALVVVAKSAVAWLLVRTTGLSDIPLQVAVGLGQIGEFSFVLASVALARGAIGQDVFAAMLAAVAATIAGSTILVRLVHRPPAPTRAVADA